MLCIHALTRKDYTMAKIDYKNLVTPADFTKAAASFDRRNTSIKTDMQNALLCAMRHMDSCGDYPNTIIPLIEAGKGFGKNLDLALKEFVLKYTWLALDGKKWHKDKDKVMNLTGAAAAQWWDTERAPKSKPFDFQLAMNTLFDNLGKELKRDGSTLEAMTVANAMLARVLELAPPENLIEGMFAKVADEDKVAVLGLLMAEVPAPAATPEVEQPEVEPEAAVA